MLKTIKYNKGFTLLEVIMSIFIVCIVSGFILQMFLISIEKNEAAKDFDTAKSKVISTLELVKSCLFYDDFLNFNYYNDNYVKNNDTYEFYKFYNENWEVIPVVQDHFNADTFPKDAKFILSISYDVIEQDKHNIINSISTDGIKEEVELNSLLLSVNTKIDVYSNKHNKEILSMTMYKYFAN